METSQSSDGRCRGAAPIAVVSEGDCNAVKLRAFPENYIHNNNNSVWLQRESPDSPFDSPGDALASIARSRSCWATGGGIRCVVDPNPPRARMSMPCPTHSQHTAGPARAPPKHAPLHAGHDDLVRVRVVQLGEREPPQVAELDCPARWLAAHRSRRDGTASLRASLIRLREGLRLCGRCARGVCGQDVESPGWDKPSAGARPPEEAVVRISLWAARALCLSGEPLDSLPY